MTPNGAVRRPLILTGGPAVGKSSTGRWLAGQRPRAAYLDVDDIRQLVVGGHLPPWGGEDGARQQLLGVENTCALGRRFLAAGFDVVVADVVTPLTALTYRRELPGCLMVHLLVSFEEARRRAATRPVWLTDEEFEELHHRDVAYSPPADHRLGTDGLSRAALGAAVEDLWAAG